MTTRFVESVIKTVRGKAILLALSLCIFIPALYNHASAQEADGRTYVELILDASGSMWNELADGRFRIDAAKDVLGEFVDNLPDGDLNVGLRIYGSELDANEAGSCDDSKLFVPLAGIDKTALNSTVQNTNARGATPIAKSLLAAADDFPLDAEKRLIVLVTDGEESCGGDLQAVAADLGNRGFDIDIRIIGFDLTPEAAASFEGIGTFENAESAEALAEALDTAVEEVVTVKKVVKIQKVQETTLKVINFDSQVIIDDANNKYLATIDGQNGSENLSPGNYSIRSSGQHITNFEMLEGEELVLDGNDFIGRLVIENVAASIPIDDESTNKYTATYGSNQTSQQLVIGSYRARVIGGSIDNIEISAGETTTVDISEYLGELKVLNTLKGLPLDEQSTIKYVHTVTDKPVSILIGTYSLRAIGGRINDIEIRAGETTIIDLNDHLGQLIVLNASKGVPLDLQSNLRYMHTADEKPDQLLAGTYSLRLIGGRINDIEIKAGSTTTVDLLDKAGWLVIEGADSPITIATSEGKYLATYGLNDAKLQLLAGDYMLKLENQTVDITISPAEELVLQLE